jgi:hypothetical protein
MFAGVYRDDAGELASEVVFAWVLGRRGSISREPGEDEATFAARVTKRCIVENHCLESESSF